LLGNVGHASLQTENEYVSLWPSRAPSINKIWGQTIPGKFNTKEDDFRAEGRIADFCIVVHTLKIEPIKDKEKGMSYHLLAARWQDKNSENCCSLVCKLILSGINYIDDINNIDNQNLVQELTQQFHMRGCNDNNVIYTPKDVVKLAIKLKEQEIKLFQRLGLDNNDIASLDYIDKKFFLLQEQQPEYQQQIEELQENNSSLEKENSQLLQQQMNDKERIRCLEEQIRQLSIQSANQTL